MDQPSRKPMQRSFMARLAGAPSQPVVELVALNLQHMLNTRRGTGSVIREYGLGEYERAPTTEEAVLALTREIPALIERYESRFAAPELRLRGRTAYNMIRFELEGTIEGRTERLELDMNTSTREVRVSIVLRPGA